MIRILLADDQALVRGGFRLILDAEPDLEVVGEAADGEQAVTLASELAPDLVLMDIRMPGLNGIEATRRLLAERNGMRVLILTTFDLDEYVVDAFRAGASGFLLKTAPPQQLVAAVRTIHDGDALLAPASIRRLLEEHAQPAAAAAALEELTSREREVLELLARGLSNAEIAAELVEVADLTANLRTHQVARGRLPIELTGKEWALLRFFLRHVGEVVDRAAITAYVWDDNHDPFTNVLEVLVRRLRAKIDDAYEPKLIHTLRGAGYRFGLPATPAAAGDAAAADPRPAP